MKRVFLAICVFLAFSCVACDPFQIKVPVGVDIGLNQATLDRIDNVNETLDEGIDIGPETRQLIEELNETFKKGIGLNEETLARVDEALRLIEDEVVLGLKVGLDSETQDIVDHAIEVVDKAPDNWRDTGVDVVRALGSAAGTVAGQMADEVERLLEQATQDAQVIVGKTGEEFRCNADFLVNKGETTIDRLIGESLIGKFQAIVNGEQPDTTPLPHVCLIIPDVIQLVETGDGLLYDGDPLRITGYDFANSNRPDVYVVDSKGAKYKDIAISPTARNSSYQYQLGLQNIDFSEVSAGSRVVLNWEGIGTHEILLQLPSPIEPPVANFDCDPACEGEAPFMVKLVDRSAHKPTEWLWEFGDGSRLFGDNELSPIHFFLSPGTYQVRLTVKNSKGQDTWPRPVIVHEKAEAKFECIPACSGEAPFAVQFISTSTGDDLSHAWVFHDGSTNTDPEPQFTYKEPGTYEVALTVSSPWSSSDPVTSTITVVAPPPEPTPLEVDDYCTIGNYSFQGGGIAFYPNCEDVPNLKVPTTVDFGSSVSGGVLPVTTTWAINGGAPSAGPSLTHTFTEPGIYTIELKVRDANGVEASRLFTLATNPLHFAEGEIVYLIYTNLGDSVYYTTNIPTSDWDCGIVGIEARGGNINAGEEGVDNDRILVAYMTANAGFWRIRADFSSREAENWKYITVMCLKKTAFDRGGYYLFREVDMGLNTSILLEADKTGGIVIDPAEYTCGIVGMLTGVGNINQHKVDRILQAYMQEAGDFWRINFDIASENIHETHWVDVLCVKNDDQLFYYPDRFESLVDGVSYDTRISAEEFFCGVVGMEALSGAIDSGSPGDEGAPMLRAFANPVGVGRFPVRGDGTWAITADTRSGEYSVDMSGVSNFSDRMAVTAILANYDPADAASILEEYDAEVNFHALRENWNVNLLCMRRPIVKPVSGDYFNR